jgi:hypothetical protein
MTDAETDPTFAALIAAFTEADFDQVPGLVQEGLDNGLCLMAVSWRGSAKSARCSAAERCTCPK